ncbi:MAG: GNAT family N-acetyltransferase [Caldimonas sp.]
MTPAFDAALLARVEDAGINASAPREQLWIDGWLVRFSPGKAKRARCVQAVAPGRLALDAKLQRCLAVYAQAGLRPYVRITPFSQPAGLDAYLEALGMERIDDSRVMVAPVADEAGASVSAVEAAAADGDTRAKSLHFQPVGSDDFADWVGGQRGSSATERRAHAERLRQAPIAHRALVLLDRAGVPVAGGQVAIEGDLAGLYDIFTSEAARGQGLARSLCRRLLGMAASEGARTAYLQVEAGNEPARRVYHRLGFVDAYAYHYRSPPAA